MKESHKAKRWVEENCPAATGSIKALLILAYGAGLGDGLKEAMELVEDIRAASLSHQRL